MDPGRGTVRLVAAGGPAVGLGHIARCTALATALRCRGFSIDARAVGLEDDHQMDGIRWRAEHERKPAGGEVPHMTVLDGYELSGDWAPVDAPLCLMHGPGADGPTGYLAVAAEDDLDQACLRRPFWSRSLRTPAETVHNVLVASGGGDAGGGVASLARRVHASLPGVSVRAVVGPFSDPTDLDGIEVLHAPADLAAPLVEADLVVTAGGQTMLEALATGSPTVAVIVAENQRPQVEATARAGAAVVCETADLEDALAGLVEDFARRTELARSGQVLVDGLGVHRTALGFLAAREPQSPLTPGLDGLDLRPATAADSSMLLALRNEPEVREASRSRHEVQPDEHAGWLREALDDTARVLMILERRGRAIGQFRLDSLAGDSWELSVSLSADARGGGTGQGAIRAASAHAFVELRAESVVASIRRVNERSRRAFLAAAFEPDEEASGADLDRYRLTRHGFRW